MVYIVLVNYNSSLDTIECVESLRQNISIDYHIIIIDNNSTKKEIDLLNSLIDCEIIYSENNIGWAAACNMGMRIAVERNIDYVLLLNNDTVVTADFMENLVEIAERMNDIGMISSKILYNDNKKIIWSAGGKYNRLRCNGKNGKYKKIDNDNLDVLEEATFLTGCCVLIPTNIIKEVGYFDETYFMYFDDLEYCRRIYNSGYKLIYTSKSVIYHKVSAASGGEYSPFYCEWNTRNQLKFIKENVKYKLIPYFCFFVFFILKNIYFLLHLKINNIKSLFRGLRKKI